MNIILIKTKSSRELPVVLSKKCVETSLDSLPSTVATMAVAFETNMTQMMCFVSKGFQEVVKQSNQVEASWSAC